VKWLVRFLVTLGLSTFIGNARSSLLPLLALS